MSAKITVESNYPELLDKLVTVEPGPGKPPMRASYTVVANRIEEFMDQGRHFVAAHMLEQLCEQVTNQPQLKVRLLGIYSDYKRLAEGLVHARVMPNQFPGNCAVLVTVAMFYQTANNPGKAVELMKQDVDLEPDDHNTHYQLGLLYRSIGETELAVECFERALELNPNSALVLFAISRAEKSRASPAFRKRVERLTQDQQYTTQGQALLHFALAWLYESIDSERHFRHLKRANDLTSEERRWNCQLSEQRCARNLKLFERSAIDQLKIFGDQQFRPIFIAAMPRSGTTLLEQKLGAHSQLYCVGENAPFENSLIATGFYGNPLSVAVLTGESLDGIQNIERSMVEVAEKHKSSLLVKAAGERRIVDKSIGNFYMAGILLLVFPKARIINIERHPLDIVYSCYQQYFSTGHNYSFDLKAAAHSYKIYQAEMQHWKNLFPNNIITIRYEDLIADNESVLRSLLSFCELPWEDSCLNYREKIGMINTASDGQVRAELHTESVEKWRKVEGFLQEAIDELGDYAIYPGQR